MLHEGCDKHAGYPMLPAATRTLSQFRYPSSAYINTVLQRTKSGDAKPYQLQQLMRRVGQYALRLEDA